MKLGSQWSSVKKSNKIQSRISCIFTINLICQTLLHCCLFKIAVNLIFPFTMKTIYIGLPLKMTLKEHQEWRCLLLCLSMYVEKLCQGLRQKFETVGVSYKRALRQKKDFCPIIYCRIQFASTNASSKGHINQIISKTHHRI